MTAHPTPAAIGFIEERAPALCVPTFGHEGLKDGESWCIRGEHVMTLADFLAEKPCPTSGT